MDGQTSSDDGTHRVRAARAADLTQIAAIENAGGPQFEEYFGAAIEPILLSPAMDGRQRAGEPGFLLVAVLDEQGLRSASSTSSSSTATPTWNSSPSCPSTRDGGSGPR